MPDNLLFDHNHKKCPHGYLYFWNKQLFPYLNFPFVARFAEALVVASLLDRLDRVSQSGFKATLCHLSHSLVHVVVELPF